MLDVITARAFWESLGPSLESATLQVRNRANDATAQYTAYALPRVRFLFEPGDYSERPVDGVVLSSLPTRNVQVWCESLDNATLAGFPGKAPSPLPGDLLVRNDPARGDGTTWIVQTSKGDRTEAGYFDITVTQKPP